MSCPRPPRLTGGPCRRPPNPNTRDAYAWRSPPSALISGRRGTRGPSGRRGPPPTGPQRRGVGEFRQLPALKWLGDHRRMPGRQRGRRKVPGPGGLSSRSPAHGARTSPRHTGCSSRRSGAGSPAQTAGQTHTLRRPRTARPRAPPRAHCGRLGGDGSSARHPGSLAAAWTAAPPAIPADRCWPNRRAGRGARPGDGRSPRQDRRLPSCARSTP